MSVSPRARVVVLLSAVLALSACVPAGHDSLVAEPSSPPAYPELTSNPEISVLSDLEYGTTEAGPLLLDLCLPPDAATTGRPAIVTIHGGSWRRGDKADPDQRAVCRWLAAEGYVTISVNYRLAPDSSFPDPLEDVQAAVTWLRDPAQVERFGIDPARIGAFGASAGGNLGALLGLTGSGAWTDGTRVAAVAELSGPSDLRDAILTTAEYSGDFAQAQLDYLGCASFADCATAAAASPVTHVDPTDPPFFVAHAVDEFIPLAQSDGLVAALRAGGVSTTFVTVEGSLHALRMLDADMKVRVIEFFHDTLGTSGLVLAEPAD